MQQKQNLQLTLVNSVQKAQIANFPEAHQKLLNEAIASGKNVDEKKTIIT